MIQTTLKGVRDTSIKAYYELLEDPEQLNETYQKILTIIKRMGPLTDREIARHLLFNDPNKIRPRRNELADPEHFAPPLIIEESKRECKVTGKTAYAWKLTKEGEEITKSLHITI